MRKNHLIHIKLSKDLKDAFFKYCHENGIDYSETLRRQIFLISNGDQATHDFLKQRYKELEMIFGKNGS